VNATVKSGVRRETVFLESTRPAVGPDDAVLRATAIVGLGAVAVIHFSQVVSTIEETPGLGAAFVVLTLGCMVLAGRLLRGGSRLLWAQVAVLNALAIGGYVFTRLVSTPFDNGDVGNWSEMLGLAALFIEGALVVLSAQVILGTLAAPGRVHVAPPMSRALRQDPQPAGLTTPPAG
jgi:hypothetical protein